MSMWILVADEARARLFSREQKLGPMTEVADFANPEGRMSGQDFMHDKPSRVQESASTARHAIESGMTHEQKVSRRFAKELADKLNEGRVGHRYEQLVMIAAPKFLGRLRAELDPEVTKLLVADAPKELSNAGPDEIRAAVDKLWE